MQNVSGGNNHVLHHVTEWTPATLKAVLEKQEANEAYGSTKVVDHENFK